MNTAGDLQAWFYRGRQSARARDPLAALDDLLEFTPAAGQRACAAGCALCCFHPVGVTEVEADRLAAFVSAGFDAAALRALRGRIAAQRADLAGRDRRDVPDARLPCVLLDPTSGRCLAYAARPIPCRGWSSLDLAACEAGARGDVFPPPRPDGPAYAAALGAQAAQAGDAEERLELTEALAARLGA